MREIIELSIHFICTLVKLMKPGGVKVVMAETMAVKKQLIVMNRGKRKASRLTTFDRFFFGFSVVKSVSNVLQLLSNRPRFCVFTKRWLSVNIVSFIRIKPRKNLEEQDLTRN